MLILFTISLIIPTIMLAVGMGIETYSQDQCTINNFIPIWLIIGSGIYFVKIFSFIINNLVTICRFYLLKVNSFN